MGKFELKSIFSFFSDNVTDFTYSGFSGIGLFFGSGIPLMDINNSSMYSIGFSVFVIIIAAMNLVVDFDFIEEGAEKGAPKYMEWFGAFGLMVTLIWLYLEILKLLAKMNSRK